MAFDPAKIEEKIDRVVTGSIELDDDGGGISMKRLVDAMEVAKMMSLSYPAVPAFMSNQPGICYAAVVRSVRWGMDPFFVAEQMYVMENPKTKEQKIGFMAQLINAVINARAPLQKKLWGVYDGEGDLMKLTVHGLPKGQEEVLTYETPSLGALIKARGKNDYGNVKGSPLYVNDPKQQLWYYGARGFCRRHFPEVLGGVYDNVDDEFEPVDAKDVSPKRATPLVGRSESLSERLKSQRKIASAPGRTFDVGSIVDQIKEPIEVGTAVGDASAAPAVASSPPAPKPVDDAAAIHTTTTE